MLPKDVTGVFSRYFVVGFYAPAFFWLATLKLALGHRFLPEALEANTGNAFVVVGVVALLAALLLSGFEKQTARLLMGIYPMPVLGRWLRDHEVKAYSKCKERAASDDPAIARRAKLRLDLYFPREKRNILPTRFGNAVRATRDYARSRWGLTELVVYPRLEMLMTEQEAQVHADTRATRAFFVNSAVAAVLSGVVLVADAIAEHPHPLWLRWIYLLPFLLAYGLYRGAVEAAVELGGTQRSTVDLHRLELYEKLGVPKPTGAGQERAALAPGVSELLLWGPDSGATAPDRPGSTQEQARSARDPDRSDSTWEKAQTAKEPAAARDPDRPDTAVEAVEAAPAPEPSRDGTTQHETGRRPES
jgi:hypothetical protein